MASRRMMYNASRTDSHVSNPRKWRQVQAPRVFPKTFDANREDVPGHKFIGKIIATGTTWTPSAGVYMSGQYITEHDIAREVGMYSYRIMYENSNYIQDFRPMQTNFHVDRNNRIIAVTRG